MLQRRYKYNIIYTIASDTILVALNLLNYCEALYSMKAIKLHYKGRSKELRLYILSNLNNSHYRIVEKFEEEVEFVIRVF